MFSRLPGHRPRRFRRLQWKLMVSYLITSMTVLCLLELVFLLIGYIATMSRDRQILESRVQMLARIAGLSSSTSRIVTNRQYQALWELVQDYDPAFRGYLVVMNQRGQVVTGAGDQVGSDISADLPPNVREAIQRALSSRGSRFPEQEVAQQTLFEGGSAYLVAPEGSGGALLIRGQYIRSPLIRDLLLFFGASELVFFLGASAVGLVFGVVTARGLVRRLGSILRAVDGWSQGNFSSFVHDSSPDELGHLSRCLNQMARQLQQLLSTQQELATLEERQRLARDLHDSIKQQMFAISLHISTTRAFIEGDREAAQGHLAKVENLIHQAQRELTTLIGALRPFALEGRHLVEAIRSYARSWQEQTGIAIELKVLEEDSVLLSIENAFFRILQEGLANVARHSQARAVQIEVTCAEVVRLSIRDDGCGFDTQQSGYHGLGLSSMRERVQALGGSIEIESELHVGTTITVSCQQGRENMGERL